MFLSTERSPGTTTDSSFPSSHGFHPHRFERFASLRRALLASLAGSVAWVCFTLLYVAFWAHGFSLFQSIVVIVVSLLLLFALLVGAWVSFGMRMAGRWDW
ncbi:MAG: hypothetical protein WB947_02160 [Thermoplasmata archaeon]